jgi:hypothetical protein
MHQNTLPTLLDAAFALAKASAGTRTEIQGAKAELAHLFPRCSRTEINRAWAAASDLEKACYAIGDACRAEHLTPAQAQADLAARFPGFSVEIYAEAVGYGMFTSR